MNNIEYARNYLKFCFISFRAMFFYAISSNRRPSILLVKVVAMKCDYPYLNVMAKSNGIFAECLLQDRVAPSSDCRFRCYCGSGCSTLAIDAGNKLANNVICEVSLVN